MVPLSKLFEGLSLLSIGNQCSIPSVSLHIYIKNERGLQYVNFNIYTFYGIYLTCWLILGSCIVFVCFYGLFTNFFDDFIFDVAGFLDWHDEGFDIFSCFLFSGWLAGYNEIRKYLQLSTLIIFCLNFWWSMAIKWVLHPPQSSTTGTSSSDAVYCHSPCHTFLGRGVLLVCRGGCSQYILSPTVRVVLII